MHLPYLADKTTDDFFRRGIPAGYGPAEALEDVLVDFLKEEVVGGQVRAAAFLGSSLARFPSNTFERRYLEFMLKRYREEKRI
jgi:hypothetical protein